MLREAPLGLPSAALESSAVSVPAQDGEANSSRSALPQSRSRS